MVGAEVARAVLCDVLAHVTEDDLLLDCQNRLGQGVRLICRHTYEVVGQALGALWANAGELVKLLYQAGQGRRD